MRLKMRFGNASEYYFENYRIISTQFTLAVLLLSPFFLIGLQGYPFEIGVGFYILLAATLFQFVANLVIYFGLKRYYEVSYILPFAIVSFLFYTTTQIVTTITIALPAGAPIKPVSLALVIFLVTLPSILYIFGWFGKKFTDYKRS